MAVWNAGSVDALEAHLGTLPVVPYNDVEITALALHPALPTPLRAAAGPA